MFVRLASGAESTVTVIWTFTSSTLTERETFILTTLPGFASMTTTLVTVTVDHGTTIPFIVGPGGQFWLTTAPEATSTGGATNLPEALSNLAGVLSTGSATNPAGEALPTITPSGLSVQSVSTISGISGNTEIATTGGSDHHSTKVPFLWKCWFCGGGGLLLWGLGKF